MIDSSNFSSLYKNIEEKDESTHPLTIIINNINSIEVLFKTLDGIKIDSLPNQIDLILFSNTDDDLQTIISPYSKSFRKIDIYKTNKFDYHDIEIDNINTEFILIINSGMILSEQFIKKSFKYINDLNLSMLFAPIYKSGTNRISPSPQLFEYFKQAIKCSLINKNLYVIKRYDNNGFIINKNSFNNFLNGDKKYYNYQKYIVDSDLRINDINLNSKSNFDFNYLYIIYFGINLLYFFVITQFLSMPNKYYLAIIIIKVIPELYYIYAYHNKLKIKFPKIEFIIYSIFIPIYIIIELFPNVISNKGLK